MKQGYKFLVKNLPFVLIGALLSTAIGVIAMKLGYNATTSWLQMTGVCTILFILAILGTIGFTIYMTVKMPKIHLARIKKSCAFLRIASVVAFMMIFFMFALETRKLILASYQDQLPAYFSTWRILKYVFALPASLHFLFMAIPSKTKRGKRIKMPKVLSYISSLGVLFWCVFGLLSAYTYERMGFTNILKIWQIIVYLTYIVFFLFETKFDLLNDGKGSSKWFIFTGCIAFIISLSISLTTTICMIFRIIPAESTLTFSATEIFTSFTIGLYAFSKIYAFVRRSRQGRCPLPFGRFVRHR